MKLQDSQIKSNIAYLSSPLDLALLFFLHYTSPGYPWALCSRNHLLTKTLCQKFRRKMWGKMKATALILKKEVVLVSECDHSGAIQQAHFLARSVPCTSVCVLIIRRRSFSFFPKFKMRVHPARCYFLCRNLTSAISKIFLKLQSLVCWFLNWLIYS